MGGHNYHYKKRTKPMTTRKRSREGVIEDIPFQVVRKVVLIDGVPTEAEVRVFADVSNHRSGSRAATSFSQGFSAYTNHGRRGSTRGPW